jgi:SAM-dependent methyltransferase
VSVAFDRAAGYYDESRGLDPAVEELVADRVEEAAGRVGRLLEVGAGLPPPPLLRADATRLPFRDACFDAVLAVHVLHLIPSWERALAEARRVLVAGGLLLSGGGGGDERGRGMGWGP